MQANALLGEHAEMILGMPLRKVFYFDPERAERAEQIIEKMLTRLKEIGL